MFERAWIAEVTCEGPPEAVWEVLVDFAAYPRWNPFTLEVECSGVIGTPVRMKVALGGKPTTQTETLVAFEPTQRLAWALVRPPRWLLWARRDQVLTALADGRTHYVTTDRIGGLLLPLVAFLYEGALQRGFRAMAAALATEVAHRARSRVQTEVP